MRGPSLLMLKARHKLLSIKQGFPTYRIVYQMPFGGLLIGTSPQLVAKTFLVCWSLGDFYVSGIWLEPCFPWNTNPSGVIAYRPIDGSMLPVFDRIFSSLTVVTPGLTRLWWSKTHGRLVTLSHWHRQKHV